MTEDFTKSPADLRLPGRSRGHGGVGDDLCGWSSAAALPHESTTAIPAREHFPEAAKQEAAKKRSQEGEDAR